MEQNNQKSIGVFFLSLFFLTFITGFSRLSATEKVLHWRFEDVREKIAGDDSGHGHMAQLLRHGHRLPFPEVVQEGVEGETAGSVRLKELSVVRSLEPVDVGESWTLSFWIKDERPEDERPEEFILGDLVSLRTQTLGFSQPWYFRTDPDGNGLEKNWNKGENAEGWDRIRVPSFWGETHVGDYLGYGWYKTRFFVPEKFAGMEHELHFEAVDEQVWVYVNGELVGEQSEESTGKTVSDLWNAPFSVNIGPEYLLPDEKNLLVALCSGQRNNAGIFLPVYFIPPVEKTAELNLEELRGERTPTGKWEHVELKVELGRASLYINGDFIASDDQIKPFHWPYDASRLELEFGQYGSGQFTGLIDDVRLYDVTLSNERIAELSEVVYHPDSKWPAGYDEAMQELIRRGRLAKVRAEYLAGLGAPSSGALVDSLERSEELKEQKDIIWALGKIGDYDAAAAVIKVLESEKETLFEAAAREMIVLNEADVFPAALEKRGDAESVALLEKVLHNFPCFDIRLASLNALKSIGSPTAIEIVVLFLLKTDGYVDIEDEPLSSHPGVETALIEVLKDDQECDEVRLEALRTAISLGAREKVQGDSQVVEALTEIILDEKSDFALRKAAVNAHPRAENLVPGLVDTLVDQDQKDKMRLMALQLIHSGGHELIKKLSDDPDAVAVLSGIIGNEKLDMELRTMAMRVHPDTDDIVSGLMDELKDTERSDFARSKALSLLTAGGQEVIAMVEDDPEAVDTLLSLALPHTASGLRISATKALSILGVELREGAFDWPMWRYDAGRSAATPYELSEDLHLQWVREFPEPMRAWRHQLDDRGKLDFDVSYAPVVQGGKIFVPSNVTDSVAAYSIDDGAKKWRFYTDGPVRLAPAAWDDKVYFTSDDGHLYCVDADTGNLVWKFRGGPSDHRLLGNERIINFWPARGGPLVTGGKVYFTAGIWPLHGIFIYALDAETGDLKWVNDTSSSDYVNLPHGGASGYGGLAPQGYLAVSKNRLVVAGGRTPPAFLNLNSGELMGADFRPSDKEAGGYAVRGGKTGMENNEMLTERLHSISDQLSGEVFYKLAAQERLFVTTKEGKLYCFGPQRTDPRTYEYNPAPLKTDSNDWEDVAIELVERIDCSGGYALMLSAGSGELMRALLLHSELHVVVVEEDSEKVRKLREELTGTWLYGRRAAVIEANPASFSVQPYLFSLVVSEDIKGAGIKAESVFFEDHLNSLRPYSGVAWLGCSEPSSNNFYEAAQAAGVDQVTVVERDDHIFAERDGPLTGAGQWTHQYHDASNTNLSHDDRVRLPLGLLWFGGPNNHNILPRHAGGPRPQVVGGRQIFLGVENIAARCVYTGRELWEREFPGIGHHATNLRLEKSWAQGQSVYMSNIPGATYIGSPFASQTDSVYLRYKEVIYRLDSATGETLSTFSLPGRPVSEVYEGKDVPDWGTLRIAGDYLITTAEPHMFENQDIGQPDSYSGTSSRIIAVLDRYCGEVHWHKEAETGFRHNAVIASEDIVYLIDGLSENALNHLRRRGEVPESPSRIYALDIASGEELWRTDSDVFGTFLLYSKEHDVLLEGGSRDMRFRGGWAHRDDEPVGRTAARRGETGEVLWQGGGFTLPGAVRGEMLIPGRPGTAISLLTGETWYREQPHTAQKSGWNYSRAYGCNTLNASQHLLLYRTGYAGYFDLEHDTGTGTFSGFRSGCTANMIAADGVLNALDYTRTCTCSYAHQTSLALVPMPGDSNVEYWTRYSGSRPDPANHGINFGAPGRRVDVEGAGRVWYDRAGTHRRHPSAVEDNGGGLDWVVASAREVDAEDGAIEIKDLVDEQYTVRLHFAEIGGSVGSGERVFDVFIDGDEVLSGFDIYAEAGGRYRGVVKEFKVKIEGNGMNLQMRRTEDLGRNPLISGVELMADF